MEILPLIGFSLLRVSTDQHVKYAGVYLAAIGAFPGGSGFLSWGLNNAAGPAVRAVSGAVIVSLGSLGAIVATWAYLPNDAPRYPIGHSINIGSSAAVLVLAIAGLLYCLWENRMRAQGKRDSRLEGLSEQEEVNLGHHHPSFSDMGIDEVMIQLQPPQSGGYDVQQTLQHGTGL
ncbi:hypothetical protein M8818_007410 [Zalaria obscura]|uniref:Uncharacterized protein n=1 Tax=Zalaria obscura TaxID=2024903 RepID=A0ACC3S3W6_9PEZI